MKYKIICYFNSEYKNDSSEIGNYSKQILKVFPEAKIFIGPDELLLLLDYIKSVLFPIIISQDYLSSDIPKNMPLVAINYNFDRKDNNLIYLYGQKKLFEKRSVKNTWYLLSDDLMIEEINKKFKNFNEYKILKISQNEINWENQMKSLIESFYFSFYYSSLISKIEI